MVQVVLGFLFLLLNLLDLEVHEVQVLLVLQVGPTIFKETKNTRKEISGCIFYFSSSTAVYISKTYYFSRNPWKSLFSRSSWRS